MAENGKFLEVLFTTDVSIAAGSFLNGLPDGDRFSSPDPKDAAYQYETGPKTDPPSSQLTKWIRLWAPDLTELEEGCKQVIADLEKRSGRKIPTTIQIKEGAKNE